jgi:hypothetical protein
MSEPRLVRFTSSVYKAVRPRNALGMTLREPKATGIDPMEIHTAVRHGDVVFEPRLTLRERKRWGRSKDRPPESMDRLPKG